MRMHGRWVGAGFVAWMLLLLALPKPAEAQSAPTPPPNSNLISANPFLLLFEWFNAEWEHRIGPNRTVGVSASHFSASDVNYTSGSAVFRVYPQERAPAGFFLGARAGLHYLEEDDSFISPDDDLVFGFGLDVGYTWLFGSQQDFALSMGAGVTRLFSDFGNEFLPSIRLVNVGWAF